MTKIRCRWDRKKPDRYQRQQLCYRFLPYGTIGNRELYKAAIDDKKEYREWLSYEAISDD